VPEQTILIATSNPGKFREIVAELSSPGLKFISLRDLPHIAPCEEHGATFRDNADQKAQYYARATGCPTIADDSGLEVDVLGGEPGVRSARYAGQPTDDLANNRKLLKALADVPLEKRTARFRCAMTLASPDGEILARSEGVIDGLILDEPRGRGGFGYDPHFYVPRLDKTTAEISQAEKNKISHRGQAARAMKSTLQQIVTGQTP